MTLAIFGLGSNVERRAEYLQRAAEAIAQWGAGFRASRMYETPALLPPDTPEDWNTPYLNQAVSVELTQAEPEALLARVKNLEAALGRRDRGRWGPREIDVDILALGDVVHNSPALAIPHAALLTRDFALLPLAEIAPDWRWPVAGADMGKGAAELAKRFSPLNEWRAA